MNEWTDPAERLPKDGQHVDILLLDNRTIKQVLFQHGFFWKFRKESRGHPYMVLKWRLPEKQPQEKKGGRQIHARATDSFITSNENTD